MDNREYSKRLIKEVHDELNNKIGELNLRSHIGKELDYLFARSTNRGSVNLLNNRIIPWDVLSSNNLKCENGIVTLEANKTYEIEAILYGKSSNYMIIDYDSLSVLEKSSYADETQKTAKSILKTTKEQRIAIQFESSTGILMYGWFSSLSITEIGREVLLDPAENAKNLEFEHGTVLYNSNSNTISANTMIPYSSQSGNLTIQDGQILLRQNKQYKISVSVLSSVIDVAGGYSVFIKNIKNFSIPIIPANYGANKFCSGVYPLEVNPQVDTLIYPYMNSTGTNIQIMVEVEEITHPYYFNYFKDSIGSKVLFEGNANAISTYSLNDDISHYEYLDILCSMSSKDGASLNTNSTYIRAYVEDIVLGKSYQFMYNGSVLNVDRRVTFSFKDNNTLSVDSINVDSANYLQITKIIGWGFNYDNPYKDLISSETTSIETTEEEMNNLTSF